MRVCPIFEIMHYSFIIANRAGQIVLHFEPNAVFSDLNSQICFVPNIDLDSNNGYDSNLFPYRRGAFKEMITEFKCDEYCFLNLSLIVVRSEVSNSSQLARMSKPGNMSIHSCDYETFQYLIAD